jgi:hypothetical protein
MWTEAKQQQLDQLWRRAATGELATADQQTLDQLLQDLEQDQWSALRPALVALRQEQGQLQTALGGVQAQHVLLSTQHQALLARRER